MSKTTTSFTRNSLEKVGKKLGSLTKQTTLNQKDLENIDIEQLSSDIKVNKNAFHEQIPKLSSRLLGKTMIGRYGKMAGKFVPKIALEKVTDTSFVKLANLAQKWATHDLNNDPRFSKDLTDSERHALAEAIGNQNRTLATLGGVTNLAGLPGILADTLWLFMVSLRSIFQTAQIYNKPLTGKKGIAVAFEILGKTNLSKLQEKQTLLAGLGMFEAIADQTTDSDKADEVDNDHDNDNSAQNIIDKIEEIASQLNMNLQFFNFGFIQKLLPVTAIGISGSYNNVIIDEVVQLSQAIFAPTPKLANAEASTANQNKS